MATNLLVALLLLLGLCASLAKAGPVRGLVDCLNDEDCVGADRLCHRNKTMTVGTCICRNGFRAALENPIKCLNDDENECHSDLDCPGHFPCVSRIPLFHAMNRARGIDNQFANGVQKQCIFAFSSSFDPPIGGFRRQDDHSIDHSYYLSRHHHRLQSNYSKFHPEYIKFVEDAMLVLFLLCVLVTLLVVHRASCYRQFRQARRNGPLRYIIPHPDDLPPPYSNYGPATSALNPDNTNIDISRDQNPDDPDGTVDPRNKTRNETPPPTYDEALAVSSHHSTANESSNPLFSAPPPPQDGAMALCPPPQTPPPPFSDEPPTIIKLSHITNNTVVV